MSDDKASTKAAESTPGQAVSRPPSNPPAGAEGRPSGIPLPSSLGPPGGAPPKVGSSLKAPRIASAVPRPSSRPPSKTALAAAGAKLRDDPDLQAASIPPQSSVPADLASSAGVSDAAAKPGPKPIEAPRPKPVPIRPRKSKAGKPEDPPAGKTEAPLGAATSGVDTDSGVIMSRIVEVQGSEEPAPPSVQPASLSVEPLADEEEDEETQVSASRGRVAVAAVPLPAVPKTPSSPQAAKPALPPVPAPRRSSPDQPASPSDEIPIDVGTPAPPDAIEDFEDDDLAMDSVPPEADEGLSPIPPRVASRRHDSTPEIPADELMSEPPPSVQHFMKGQAAAPPPAPGKAPTAQPTPPQPPPPPAKKPRRSRTPAPGAIAAALSHPPPASSGPKRRLWWESMFNEEFQRGLPEISDEQLVIDADFIQQSLGLKAGARVLDVGCGRGEHALELSARDFDLVGIDISKNQLATAGEYSLLKGKKIQFVNLDMREMTFDGEFDGVYCWNTSFGYFEEEKNVQVLRNVFQALRPGGRLLLDVVNRDFVIADEPSQNWFEGDGCACMDDMSVDFITSRMRVKRTMIMDDGRNVESHYSIRVYSLHELGKMFHEVGFRVTQASGDPKLPGVLFGAQSPRLIILAVKP